MFKSVEYKGNMVLGELEVSLQSNVVKFNKDDCIRITQFSPPSDRCPPLAVVHMITSSGLCFKMEPVRSQPPDPQLVQLHNCCIKENKEKTQGNTDSFPSGRFHHNNTRPFKESFKRDHRMKPNYLGSNINSFPSEEAFIVRSAAVSRSSDFDTEHSVQYSENPANYLQDIAIRCGTKIWFAGKKAGDGIGRTRKEAQIRAAVASLMHLADRYIKQSKAELHEDGNNPYNSNDRDFGSDASPSSEQYINNAEVARHLRSKHGQFAQKRQGSPRSFQGMSNKRFKPQTSIEIFSGCLRPDTPDYIPKCFLINCYINPQDISKLEQFVSLSANYQNDLKIS